MKGFALSGHLMFQNQQLQAESLNTIAVTIPYIANMRYINLQNCGVKDEQMGYIIRACKKLQKFSELHLG